MEPDDSHDVQTTPTQDRILSKPTTSHPVSLRFFLILSSHPRLGLPGVSTPATVSTNIFHAFLISSKQATSPAPFIFLNLITQITSDKYNLWRSPVCRFLKHLYFYFLPFRKQHLFILSTVITLPIRVLLWGWDYVSTTFPYAYILIFMYQDRKRQNKIPN